ncbi:5-methylcytosine restriction system specificity protein McrC [Nocardiopsis rhodophaea]|uniref:McrC family protein n=1 Tax=Nocardiopsis rhodophaea TaxID=280238 RepID=UPI0031D69C6A
MNAGTDGPSFPIALTEYSSTSGVSLSERQSTALEATGMVTMSRGHNGLWTLKANKELAGAVVVSHGDEAVELRIEPKLPIRRLMFLIGYAQRGVMWNDDLDNELTDAGEHDGLLPAMALAFARMADGALAQGVMLGYRTVEEALPVVRGRVRESAQIRGRYGAMLPVEVGYADYTVDIAENQILLAATHRILHIPGLPTSTRALLRRVRARLNGVTLTRHKDPLPDWHPSRLNTRYQAALRLGELVLRDSSYEPFHGDGIRVEGVMLRMWQIFEDFVANAVTDALRPRGGHCASQDEHYLDQSRSLELRADLVYYESSFSGTRRPAGVVDAKYKFAKDDSPERDVLYQMLAYCTVLNLSEGHLIYAAGPKATARRGARSHVHRLNGPSQIAIHHHILDLDQSCATERGHVAAQNGRLPHWSAMGGAQ